MISDILSDAIHEIRRYQQDMPECYGDDKTTAKIEDCLKVMDNLRIYFDTPPSPKCFDCGRPIRETECMALSNGKYAHLNACPTK